MSRADKIALLLSAISAIASYLVADRVFERLPHLEDEIAYVWQARTIAGGQLFIESPPHQKQFLIPFVVDYEGRRFGKYPLGWPALLSVGVWLGARALVNPLLAGLAVWLTYCLGKTLLGETVGLLAGLLTVTSPYFLLNSGSLLAHPLGLVLSLAFVLAWWDAFGNGRGGWLPPVTAGLALGAFAITRPFTALGVAFPFALYGFYLFLRGTRELRLQLITLGGITLLVSSLHFLWQYAVTGDPGLNPYTLWWPYDKVGFGPGFGVTRQGHNLRLAWINTRFTLWVGYHDLFGWAGLSWIFLPFGAWAIRRNGKALLTSSVFFSLLVLYLAYWIGAWLFGPRYQFEGLYSLTLLSGAGIAFLAGWPSRNGARWRTFSGWGKMRPLGVTAFLAVLFSINLIFYLPKRLNIMFGLYNISRSRLEPFESLEAQAIAPATIIVHANHWTDYGTLLDLEDPFLTTPFIFTFGDKPGLEESLRALFPERDVYHYYPDEPFKFYMGERAEQ